MLTIALRSAAIVPETWVVRANILKTLNLSMPPLPEQRAIAAALSDVDALIAALDALIAKKRDIKQAAMQQLLTGKTRLPGFGGEWDLSHRIWLSSSIQAGSRCAGVEKVKLDRAYPEVGGRDIPYVT